MYFFGKPFRGNGFGFASPCWGWLAGWLAGGQIPGMRSQRALPWFQIAEGQFSFQRLGGLDFEWVELFFRVGVGFTWGLGRLGAVLEVRLV